MGLGSCWDRFTYYSAKLITLDLFAQWDTQKSSFLEPFMLKFIQLKEISKGDAMAVNVKLSVQLVEQAKLYGGIEHRSIPKQIEYWSQIGKIAQENPDLPFSMIREILIADKEPVVGEYVFSWCDYLLLHHFWRLPKNYTPLKKPNWT